MTLNVSKGTEIGGSEIIQGNLVPKLHLQIIQSIEIYTKRFHYFSVIPQE